MTLLVIEENNCAKLVRNPCIDIESMALTNLDGRTDARTQAQMQKRMFDAYAKSFDPGQPAQSKVDAGQYFLILVIF